MKAKPLQKENRLPGLNGLRALAALSVFGVHFNQIVQFDCHIGPVSIYRLLSNGNHAVSLFFSLSGFLLSLPFWKATASGSALPDMKGYMLRRLCRILPAYYAALTILILLGGLWRAPGTGIDILLHYTFLFNYTEFSIFSINPPFWTLAVEVQFYILLPCFFLLAQRIRGRNPLLVILFVGVGAYVMHYWLISSISRIVPWPYNPWLTWIRPHGAVLSHSILANLPHFLIGMAMGRLSLYVNQFDTAGRQKQYAAEITFWICLTSALILLGTGWDERVSLPYAPYGLPVVPVLLAAMIFTVPFTHIARRLLDGPLLRNLGAISYGFYIYHVPCLNFLDRTMAKFGTDAAERWILFGCAGIVLTAVVASVSYIVVEMPCLKYVRSKQKTKTRP